VAEDILIRRLEYLVVLDREECLGRAATSCRADRAGMSRESG
jgi:hypothetical protein